MDVVDENVYAVGQRIRALRVARGMSQNYVADRLGYVRASVSHWELGARVPDVRVIYALADLFGVKPAELLPVLPRRN